MASLTWAGALLTSDCVLRHLQEQGKQFDFVLTIDSDGEPFPEALEQQLRAMSNPKIQATLGMIYIRNFEETWVSRAAASTSAPRA
ncbi:hypothetical protein [Streptomyces sp. NPDC056938]|uniref:hypothetical protein n=1 Tax=Streptomyces sp. NPDC056938 TaxID=3345970 RepID=UPI003638E681